MQYEIKIHRPDQRFGDFIIAECTPPMLMPVHGLNFLQSKSEPCRFVSLHVCSVAPGIPRTVISAAKQSADYGWSIAGGHSARIVDGTDVLSEAMALQGYSEKQGSPVTELIDFDPI